MSKQKLLILSLTLAACLTTGQQAGFAEDLDTSKWTPMDADSNPLTMCVPPGWTATTDKATGRIDVKESRGASLSVQPFFIANQTMESLNPKQFFALFVKAYAPNESWSEPQVVGNNYFRTSFKNDEERTAAAMIVVPQQNGIAGQVCIARVPKAAEDVGTDVFAAMLSTLKYGAVPKPPETNSEEEETAEPNAVAKNSEAPGQTEDDVEAAENETQAAPVESATPQGGFSFNGWTRFTDPSESSFQVDVPSGWKVDGGLTRVGALDVRPWVKAVSPDEMITAFIGDGKIAPCTMPTSTLTTLGFRQGTMYQGSLILPYIPARQFAEKYARSNLGKFISGLTVIEEHNHPDVALAVNGTVGATKSEAASIKLTGMYGSIPAVAYYLAVTKATVAHGTGMWWVTKVAGVVGPADRDAEGLAVILHMLQSFQVDQAWASNSLRNTGEVSRHYSRVSQQISRSISDRYWSQQAHNERMNQAYWNRQASQDRAADNFSNYIRGVENVQDPSTGEKYQVQYGPQSHYIDPTGNYIYGGDHGAPSPDWRQLMSVP